LETATPRTACESKIAGVEKATTTATYLKRQKNNQANKKYIFQ
jgi:hypothetical protein